MKFVLEFVLTFCLSIFLLLGCAAKVPPGVDREVYNSTREMKIFTGGREIIFIAGPWQHSGEHPAEGWNIIKAIVNGQPKYRLVARNYATFTEQARYTNSDRPMTVDVLETLCVNGLVLEQIAVDLLPFMINTPPKEGLRIKLTNNQSGQKVGRTIDGKEKQCRFFDRDVLINVPHSYIEAFVSKSGVIDITKARK